MNRAADGYVKMERHVCPVCGAAHETEAILLNKRLTTIPKGRDITGYSPCPEHKKLHDDGYIALVELTTPAIDLNDAATKRTGNIAHVKREIWSKLFDMAMPEGPMVFVEVGVIAKLQEKISP